MHRHRRVVHVPLWHFLHPCVTARAYLRGVGAAPLVSLTRWPRGVTEMGTCQAASLDHANLPEAFYDTTVTGVCQEGYGGNATAKCNVGGAWTMLTAGCARA